MPCASAIYKQPRWSTQGYPFLHPINTRNADPRFLGSAPASFLRQQGVSPRRPALPQVYWSGIPLNAPAMRACQRGLRFECCGSTTPNLEAEATPSAATGSHDLSGALSNERGPAIRSSEAVRLAGARPPDGRSGYTLTGQTIEQRGHGGRVLAAELATDEIVRGRIDFDAIGHYARRDIFSLQVNGRPMPAVRTRFAERQEIALDSERDTVKGVPPSRHGTDEAAPH